MKEKTEPRFIVYVRGIVVKLTSRNPVSIEREIKTRFNDVESIHLRGVSLKITCKSEEQRNNIRGCTSLGDTSVVASLPFSGERRRREAVPKLHRVAIGGVPSMWPRRRSRTRQERHSSSESRNAISPGCWYRQWQSCWRTTTMMKYQTRFSYNGWISRRVRTSRSSPGASNVKATVT